MFFSLTGLPQAFVLPDAVCANVLFLIGMPMDFVLPADRALNRPDVVFVVIGLWNGRGLQYLTK